MIEQIFNDEGFKREDFNKQQQVLSNYFDSELADGEFKAKDSNEQQRIKNNFIMKTLTNIGAIKPREDGAGFLTRSKFSFASTDAGRKQVLEDEYGKGNAYKIGDRWLINEGKNKGWNYVDEKGFNWKDLADIAGDVPEIAGGIIGSRGGIVGAGAGSAGGDSIKKLIAKAMGINDNQNATEIAKDMAVSGVVGAGAQGLGNLVGKYGKIGVDAITKPFANSMKTNADDIIRIAKENGIDIMPTMINDSKSLATLENSLAKGFGGDRITDIRNSQNAKLDLNTIGLLNSLTKGKSSQQIGNDVLDAIKTNRAEKNQYLGGEYDKLGKAIEDLSQQNQGQPFLPLNETKMVSDDILNNYSKYANPKSIELSDAILKTVNDGGYEKYNHFKTDRSNLIDEISKATKNEDKNLARELTNIKKSMDTGLDNKLVGSGLGAEKKALDSEFASFKDIFDNPSKITGDILSKSTSGGIKPENIPQSITSGITNAENITSALNGDKDLLSQSFAKVLEKASRKTNGENTIPLKGTVSMDKLNTSLINNKDTFEYAFDPVIQKELSDKILLSKAINSAEKNYGNPSGTAQGLSDVIPLTIGATTGLGGAAAYLGAKIIGPKAYTSDIGKKYLTDGFDVSGSGFSNAFFNQPVRQSGFYEALKGLEEKYNK